MLPEWFYLSVAALFGLIIGSFLNVVIYRLHTGRSLNDRSHCLSCGTPLHWYELFPVVSYVALLGRCRTCGSLIPYRYALVELLTAGAFILSYLKAASAIELILLCGLVSVLIVGLVYDLYHMVIPDEVSYGALGVTALLVSYEAVNGGGWEAVLMALGGAAAVFLAFASLWFFSRGRAFGFGDAKLALSLGALVGLGGAFSLVALSFWVGVAIVLGALAWRAASLHIGRRRRPGRRVTMKSEVPFAPFLIIAFGLVYFFHVDVLATIADIYRLW